MPAFAFTARDRQGRTVRGRRLQGSEQALVRTLETEGLFPIRIRPVAAASRGLDRLTLKPREFSMLLLHLASYLEAGLTLLDAFRDYQGLDLATMELSNRIAGGEPLSEAMAACPRLFQPIHVCMIAAGEASGQLSGSIRAVIALVEWEADFRREIRRAGTYPLVLIVLVILMGSLVASVVLPPMIAMLKALQVPLPLTSRILIEGVQWAGQDGWILPVLALGLGCTLKSALRQPGFRLRWDSACLTLPFVGPLLMRLALARFSRFLEQQYRSGIPIVQALRQSEGVTGNARIGQSVHAIRHGVEQGEKLAVMAARVGCFPRLIVRMLATGEETGHLEETLRKAGNQFEAEGTEAVKRMFTIVEPCLLLAVGGIMLFIFLAILLPIYTLQGAIHG